MVALRCLWFVVGYGFVLVVARSFFAAYVCLFVIVLLLHSLGCVVVCGTLIVDRCMLLAVFSSLCVVRCSLLLFVVRCCWCMLLFVV